MHLYIYTYFLWYFKATIYCEKNGLAALKCCFTDFHLHNFMAKTRAACFTGNGLSQISENHKSKLSQFAVYKYMYMYLVVIVLKKKITMLQILFVHLQIRYVK